MLGDKIILWPGNLESLLTLENILAEAIAEVLFLFIGLLHVILIKVVQSNVLYCLCYSEWIAQCLYLIVLSDLANDSFNEVNLAHTLRTGINGSSEDGAEHEIRVDPRVDL